ncbi:MAG: hypothetical protein ACT4QG_15460 [Sporichthyaceae bacterium]
MTTSDVDLVVDLNCVDDTDLPWAFLDSAEDPAVVRVGSHILVGSGEVRAVALVVDVADGLVHVRPIHGSVDSNAHLLDDPGRIAS